MAGTAIIQSGDMGVCLASRYLTIMTGVTIVNNIPMIERCAYKCICCEMAERTILSSRQVIVRESSADYAIMAGCAIAAYTVVIKDTGGKNAGCMAYATILGGRHMVV
jgi:wyosine [tRNA(Phe)-imidazoG37] synthetase (radical SAM superfamily)